MCTLRHSILDLDIACTLEAFPALSLISCMFAEIIYSVVFLLAIALHTFSMNTVMKINQIIN